MNQSVSLLREYLKKRMFIFSLYIVIGMIRNLSAFLLSVSIGQFFALHFHSSSSKGRLLGRLGIELSTMNGFFVFFFCLILIRGIFEFLDKAISGSQGEGFARFVREKLFEKQIRSHGELFADNYYGKYLLRYSNDMKAIQNYLSRGILGGIRDFGFIILGIWMIALISGKVALVVLGFSFLMMLLFKLFAAGQMSVIQESRKERSNLLSFVTKSFQRHKKIAAGGEETKVIDRFNLKSDRLFSLNVKNNQLDSLRKSMLSITQFLLIASILLIISTGNLMSLDANDAVVLILVILLLNSAFKRWLEVPAYLNKGKISLLKINSLLALGDQETQIQPNS